MKKIPVWVLLIAGFFVVAPLAFSIMGYTSPNALFANLDADVSLFVGLVGLYYSRNLAAALLMVVALFKRKPHLLVAAFLLRLFIDILNMIDFFVNGGGLNPIVLVFVVLTVIALWRLWPITKAFSE